MSRLANKVALVTGGAAGQGCRVAHAFAEAGARVFIIDIDDERGEQTADDLRSAGADAIYQHADISSESDWVSVADVVSTRFGRVDVLYNNAALFTERDGPVTELDVETWDRVFAVNVRGIYLGCKHTVPLMAEAAGGSIINVSSIRAWLGTSIAQDAYAATKGAVLALSRSMAVHLAPQQIRVNSICPGTIQTEMAPIADPAAATERLARYPLGRFGTTEDVVGAAVFLASDESAWITGTELPVDGGTSAFYV